MRNNARFEYLSYRSGKENAAMHELFPIVAGVLTALVVQGVVATRLRAVSIVGSSIVFGALASLISGELLVSWAYLVFDFAQVLITAIATTVLIAWWQRGSIRYPND
jgi:hypothetical protein